MKNIFIIVFKILAFILAFFQLFIVVSSYLSSFPYQGYDINIGNFTFLLSFSLFISLFTFGLLLSKKKNNKILSLVITLINLTIFITVMSVFSWDFTNDLLILFLVIPILIYTAVPLSCFLHETLDKKS